MWWRRSWFSLKGKADIPGQTEGCPATSIGPRVLPVGSLQQRDAKRILDRAKTPHAHLPSGERWLPYRWAARLRPGSDKLAELAKTSVESLAEWGYIGSDH